MDAPAASTIKRLRARGDVRIVADSTGIHVTWWPKGQMGNPFCARGSSGLDLDAMLSALEEETRPPTRDWDDARYASERQAERDAENNLRFWMRQYDRDDRRREKRDAEKREMEVRRLARQRMAERNRVREALS